MQGYTNQDENSCTFSGNLGADPEMRFTGTGKAVTTFRIAVNGYRNVEWVSLTAWEQLAEQINQEARKGTRIRVHGRVQTRKWTAQDGSDKYTTEFVIDAMQILSQPGARVTVPAGVGANAEDTNDLPF